MRRFSAVDLFCGAGGESEGLRLACEAAGLALDLTAINHWDIAVETHSRNHPTARHLCETLDSIQPHKVHKPGSLDLLWASPECVHHSNARGGKPMNDQSRASAWHVVRWADALRPKWIGVENVREFLTWGPLGSDGRPLKSKRGTLFTQWKASLETLGYTVEAKVLCAADYGAATTRRRLFVLARFDGGRPRGPIRWPIPTHGQRRDGLFGGELVPWRAAREVIDWTLPSASIFTRRKDLSDNTLARIGEGLRRFGGAASKSFLLQLSHGGRVMPTTNSLCTLTATPVGGDMALVQPFLVQFYGEGSGKIGRSVERPVPTLTTKDRFGLVQPQLADIHFRMLQPHECAAGQGFRFDYSFAGNKGEQMKQIGNAVEVNQALALNTAIVAHRTGAAA